jgi:hypothetical protein
MACPGVKNWTKGMARLRKVLGGRESGDLLDRHFTRAGAKPKYCDLLARLFELSDEAVKGLDALLGLIHVQNPNQVVPNLIEVFDRIPDNNHLEEFLTLVREAFDQVPAPGGGAPGSRLQVLANSLTGPLPLKGVWYQLDFAKTKQFRQVRQFEVPTAPGSGVRGIDVELETDVDGRWFETKSFAGFDKDQSVGQIAGIMARQGAAADDWRKYRVVVNVGQHHELRPLAAQLLEALASQDNVPPFRAIFEALSHAAGFNVRNAVRAGDFLPAYGALNGQQQRVIDVMQLWFFVKHTKPIPIN